MNAEFAIKISPKHSFSFSERCLALSMASGLYEITEGGITV